MTIYAIIVTYNGSKWIDKCFGSLVNSTIPLKILAIDNASTDGTPGIIKEKFPQVEVIETGQNLGFGKANNIGLKRVLEEKADYAFLLNQDAWVEEDTIKKLIKIQKENPEYHLLSPIHLNGKGDAIDRNFQNYLGNNFTPGFFSDLYLKKKKTLYEGKYANAAAWLLSYHCVKTVGGFDPLFKQYGEDNDYISRLHQAQLKLAIVPDTVIYHDRPQDGKMNDSFYKNQSYTRALLSVKANQPPKKTFLLRKIFTDYIAYYIAYMGKNKHLKTIIQSDIKILKLKKKALKQKKQQSDGSAFLK
jgi:N-acetylglucosaminyl-diphospho-decaprenol L-rhamnosyltransferase